VKKETVSKREQKEEAGKKGKNKKRN